MKVKPEKINKLFSFVFYDFFYLSRPFFSVSIVFVVVLIMGLFACQKDAPGGRKNGKKSATNAENEKPLKDTEKTGGEEDEDEENDQDDEDSGVDGEGGGSDGGGGGSNGGGGGSNGDDGLGEYPDLSAKKYFTQVLSKSLASHCNDCHGNGSGQDKVFKITYSKAKKFMKKGPSAEDNQLIKAALGVVPMNNGKNHDKECTNADRGICGQFKIFYKKVTKS